MIFSTRCCTQYNRLMFTSRSHDHGWMMICMREMKNPGLQDDMVDFFYFPQTFAI